MARKMMRISNATRSDLGTLASRLAEIPPGISETEIADWLYANWYTRYPANEDDAGGAMPFRSNLAQALSACVHGKTRWRRGWTAIQANADGAVHAGRDALVRSLRPGEYANVSRPGSPVAPGDELAAPMAIDWVDETTGYWCTKPDDDDLRGSVVRVYFSARLDQAGYVVREVTRLFDEAGFRYSLKTPSMAAAFARADSMVAYLEAVHWPDAETKLRRARRRFRGLLRDARPPLTKPVIPGVAYAQDPGNRESFGQNRCKALARAVAELLRSPDSVEARVQTMACALAEQGIDTRQPWLCSELK